MASSLSLAGAERITRSAPASMCFWSAALLVKKPVDSRATWQSRAFQGRLAGSFSVVILMCLPLTIRPPSATSTVPSNRPWTLSYFRRRARCLASERSLIATISKSWGWRRHGAEDQPTDPTEPVDPDANRHACHSWLCNHRAIAGAAPPDAPAARSAIVRGRDRPDRATEARIIGVASSGLSTQPPDREASTNSGAMPPDQSTSRAESRSRWSTAPGVVAQGGGGARFADRAAERRQDRLGLARAGDDDRDRPGRPAGRGSSGCRRGSARPRSGRSSRR